ncbi:MAG TPA: hypothetical protein VIH22_16115 [Cyclobacteriaceae bacterium]
MKTSNILLASLFGSITITTMAMMADIGFGGGSREYTEYEQENIELPPFRHLQVHHNGRSVAVEASSSPSIRLFSMKGDQMPSIAYHMQGDTLVIERFEDHDLVGAYFTIQAPLNELQGVTARNTEVVLNDYPFERMALYLDNSRVQIYPKTRNHLSMLLVEGSNHAHVNISSQVDTLALTLNQSSVVIDDAVTLLSGSIENSSSVGVREVGIFDFSKDASSRLDHWD